MSLFRPEAVDARRNRLMGEVRLSQPPSLAIWTGVLGIVAACIVVTLVFGTYVRKETVRGYLAPDGGIIQVYSSRSGKVARVMVREGARINPGDPLIEFSGDSSGTGASQILASQMQQVVLQIENARTRQVTSVQSLVSENARLQGQVTALKANRALLEKRANVQRLAAEIDRSDLIKYEELLRNGYSTAVQVNQRRQIVLAQESALLAIEGEIRTIDGAISDLQNQVAEVPVRITAVEAETNSALSVLEQQRIDLASTMTFVERSPVKGVVTSLQAEVGQTVKALPLMSLMTDDADLQAELLLPSRAIGFIRPGHEVRLQVDAYPFQRFGFIQGRVLSVSRSTITPGEFLAPIEFKESVYRVKVILDRDYIDAYGKKQPLAVGMELTADIVIDKKPLWRQLFDPLLAAARRST